MVLLLQLTSRTAALSTTHVEAWAEVARRRRSDLGGFVEKRGHRHLLLLVLTLQGRVIERRRHVGVNVAVHHLVNVVDVTRVAREESEVE